MFVGNLAALRDSFNCISVKNLWKSEMISPVPSQCDGRAQIAYAKLSNDPSSTPEARDGVWQIQSCPRR
jgi:hypothetical protein